MQNVSTLEKIMYAPIVKQTLGFFANKTVYPTAERLQNRSITKFSKDIGKFRQLPIEERNRISHERLMRLLRYCAEHVPFYADEFKKRKICLNKIEQNSEYFFDLPIIDKTTIREEGDRLLSRSLDSGKFLQVVTSGSTGPSLKLYYDQTAADKSAAVTKYCRSLAGKKGSRSELHFACYFGDPNQLKWWNKETLKCAAMNRSNIFFASLENEDLEQIFFKIKLRRPFLVHGHPSTMYFLARYVLDNGLDGKIFDVFEPSGETLDKHMDHLIRAAFGCEIRNRYGLAEFGIVAYQEDVNSDLLRVFESDFFVETTSNSFGSELVVTGYHNYLMPLIRYRTGDIGQTLNLNGEVLIANLVGRTHDQIVIGGKNYLSHHLQDIFEYKIGGIVEFQIVTGTPPEVLLYLERHADFESVTNKIRGFFGENINFKEVGANGFITKGINQKFRHVVRLDD